VPFSERMSLGPNTASGEVGVVSAWRGNPGRGQEPGRTQEPALLATPTSRPGQYGVNYASVLTLFPMCRG
jgi:hypothetical protein